jgi:hypothetical protein
MRPAATRKLIASVLESQHVLKSGADDDIVIACRAATSGQPFLYHPPSTHSFAT